MRQNPPERLVVEALCQALPSYCPQGAAQTTAADLRTLDGPMLQLAVSVPPEDPLASDCHYVGFQTEWIASQQEPSYRVKGVLTDGFDSTTKSMRTLFPGVRVGNCLRHALLKLPKKLAAIASPVRQSLRTKFRV